MRARLTITAGTDVGKEFVIRAGQTFVLGRGKGVTIKVLDREVSRRHALVEMRGDGLYLTDLRSRNKTFLDGQPVEAATPTGVDDGQTIAVGRHHLKVELITLDDEVVMEPARLYEQLDLPRAEYEILGQIGGGGAGVIWAARQLVLGRNVAIKVLKARLDDEETKQRYLREVRVCLQVKSPYVVELYDARIPNGIPILIMELVQGPSAYDRVRQGSLPIGEALKIAHHTAMALEVAHERAIVHRDLKPHNILLAPDGTAKLSDFGIAKDLHAEPVTRLGLGMGSINYVSPEQSRNARDVDTRTDLYSLGATLYHLITGRPPVVCTRPNEMLAALEELESKPPPPVLGLRPDCPPEVVELIDALLRKHPDQRPQPASVVAKRLELICERHPPPDDPDEFPSMLGQTISDG